MNFKPLRLSVVLLGDRLAIAALRGARVEAFTVDAESPAAALRAELDARGLPARNAFFALSRSAGQREEGDRAAAGGRRRAPDGRLRAGAPPGVLPRERLLRLRPAAARSHGRARCHRRAARAHHRRGPACGRGGRAARTWRGCIARGARPTSCFWSATRSC